MATTTYRTAGLVASAAAPRPRSVVAGAGLAANACSWPIAPAAAATKPATQMFVDVLDHRRRRLSEPSP